MSRIWRAQSRVVAGVVLLAAAGSAWADNTSCANAIRLVPDGSRYSGSFASASEARWFVFSAAVNRSYAIMVDNTAPSDVNAIVATAAPRSDCSATPAAGTITSRSDQEPVGFDALATGSGRVTLVSTAAQRAYLYVQTGTSAGSFQIRVVETTMFSPSWTTNGSYNTYWSFTNTTGSSISGTLQLLNLAGDTIVSSAAVTIPANGSAATNTVALSVPRSNVGIARFVHDGSPGSVLILASMANFTTTPAYIQNVPFKAVRGDLW